MIVVEDTQEQRFDEWFLEQIGKCEAIVKTAEKLEFLKETPKVGRD